MPVSSQVPALTCPLCLNADEASAMVRVDLEHAAFGRFTTLCRLCAYAIALVVTGSGEPAPVSAKDLNGEVESEGAEKIPHASGGEPDLNHDPESEEEKD